MVNLTFKYITLTLLLVIRVDVTRSREESVAHSKTSNFQEGEIDRHSTCRITVSRKSNQPDHYAFHYTKQNGVSNIVTSKCTDDFSCDVTSREGGNAKKAFETECKCSSLNETFYGKTTKCHYGTDEECYVCFASSQAQTKLINLLDKKSVYGLLARCRDDGLPPPAMKDETVSLTNEENQFENCIVKGLYFEDIQKKVYSRWRKLIINKDSKLQFHLKEGNFWWRGTECELRSLSGQVLKLSLNCKGLLNEEQCIVVKTAGEAIMYPNKPNQTQIEFNKCQQDIIQSVSQAQSASIPQSGNAAPTASGPSLSSISASKTPSLLPTPYSYNVPTLSLSPTPTLNSEAFQTQTLVSMTTVATKTETVAVKSTLISYSSSILISEHIIRGASLKSAFRMGIEYPYVNTQGNNGVIILVAGVTAFISMVMILLTAVLVIRRNQREKKEGHDESEYSTYDERSRSESMFEVARKIYIVEKHGSLDYNLNVGVPESILKPSRKGSESDRKGVESRPRNKSSTSSLTPSVGGEQKDSNHKPPKSPPKLTCDCATYTEHDIPSLISPTKDINFLDSSGLSHRRRKTWNSFDASKNKNDRVPKKRAETSQTTLEKDGTIDELNTSLSDNPSDSITIDNETKLTQQSSELADVNKIENLPIRRLALIEEGENMETTGIINEAYSTSSPTSSPLSSPITKDAGVQAIPDNFA